MKLFEPTKGVFTGACLTTWPATSFHASIGTHSSGVELTHICIPGHSLSQPFLDIYVEDCPPIRSEWDIWQVIIELKLFLPAIEALRKKNFTRGYEGGRSDLQDSFRKLLRL